MIIIYTQYKKALLLYGYFKLRKLIALFGISLLFFFEYFSLNLLNVIEPSIKTEFNFTHTEIGWLGSVYFYAMVILLIPAGYILDKFKLKNVIIISTVGGTIGTFLLSISQNYFHLILSRMMVGIFLGPFALISCIKFISKLADRKEISLFISIILTIGIFGGTLSQNGLGFLVEHYGWRRALLIVSLLGLCISIIITLTVNLYKKNLLEKAYSNDSFLTMFMFFFKNTNIDKNIKLGVMASVLNLPLFILGSLFGITFLEKCYGLPIIEASSITTQLFYGMLIGCILFGLFSSIIKEESLLCFGGIVLLFSLVVLILLPNLSKTFLKLIFFAIGIGAGSNALSYTLVEKLSSYHNLGFAEGFHSTIIFFTGALIQIIFGLLLDLFNSCTIEENIQSSLNSKIPFDFGFILLIALIVMGIYYMKTSSYSNEHNK